MCVCVTSNHGCYAGGCDGSYGGSLTLKRSMLRPNPKRTNHAPDQRSTLQRGDVLQVRDPVRVRTARSLRDTGGVEGGWRRGGVNT